jgi:hypothetical protein
MDQERRQALEEALENLEAIGFFAAIGMHFAESTPLLSEDLGDRVKGAPWERFSSTDQCFKMIHNLAAKVWHNLEEIAVSPERELSEPKEPVRTESDFANEKKEPAAPEKPPGANEQPTYCQRIAGELRFLKTMGESIVSCGAEGKQDREMDQPRLRSLGEMVINTANTIIGKLQGPKDKVFREGPGGAGPEPRPHKPLELVKEEVNSVKVFGSSLVAMTMAVPDGFKLNPRQIETIGNMVMDLTDKVAEKLTRAEQPQLTLVSG